MFNHSIIWGLVLLITFVVTGCQEQQKPPAGDPLAYGPPVKEIVVTDAFISKAITATGGSKAWANAKKLELDCVVTCYNKDGSSYFTQQHHDIYPWSNAIRISSVEPRGKFVWLLSKDSFSAELPEKAYIQYDIRNTMYAIRYITTASVRLLDKSVGLAKENKPVKIEGLWHYPIRCSTLSSQATGNEPRRVVFYQSKDTYLIDTVRFVSAAGMKPIMVRGYDYHQVGETGVLLPARIEVFKTSSLGVVQKRLLEVDYHSPCSTAGPTESE